MGIHGEPVVSGDVNWNASNSGNSLAPIAVRHAPPLVPHRSRRTIPLPPPLVPPPGSPPTSPRPLPLTLLPRFAPPQLQLSILPPRPPFPPRLHWNTAQPPVRPNCTRLSYAKAIVIAEANVSLSAFLLMRIPVTNARKRMWINGLSSTNR